MEEMIFMKNTTDLYYAIWKALRKHDKNAVICLEKMNGKKISEFDATQINAMYDVQEYILLEALEQVRQKRECCKSKM
jgi:hypothetical protein